MHIIRDIQASPQEIKHHFSLTVRYGIQHKGSPEYNDDMLTWTHAIELTPKQYDEKHHQTEKEKNQKEEKTFIKKKT